jgi:hypothetical protein
MEQKEVMQTFIGAIKNLGLSDEQLEAWKKGEIYITYPGGRNGVL